MAFHLTRATIYSHSTQPTPSGLAKRMMYLTWSKGGRGICLNSDLSHSFPSIAPFAQQGIMSSE
jgi:hypothetical protein